MLFHCADPIKTRVCFSVEQGKCLNWFSSWSSSNWNWKNVWLKGLTTKTRDKNCILIFFCNFKIEWKFRSCWSDDNKWIYIYLKATRFVAKYACIYFVVILFDETNVTHVVAIFYAGRKKSVTSNWIMKSLYCSMGSRVWHNAWRSVYLHWIYSYSGYSLDLIESVYFLTGKRFSQYVQVWMFEMPNEHLWTWLRTFDTLQKIKNEPNPFLHLHVLVFKSESKTTSIGLFRLTIGEILSAYEHFANIRVTFRVRK